MKLLSRLLTPVLLLSIFESHLAAQNALFIPDTLTGTSITLSLSKDSVQFLPGNKSQTFGFNGYKYFGPTIILNNGQQLNVTVNNNIGDTTTVHWHGLHVAAVNDGGPHSMIMDGMSWNPHFTVMNNAATYWYHPHLDGKTGLQALRGAAGVIIVRDSVESMLNLPRKYGVDDLPVVVQSHEFDLDNQINPRAMSDSILLVNGTLNPYVNLPAQVVRLRLLNASQERTFNFGLTGNKSFSVIGNDGGLLSAPVATTRISVSPGERAEILVDLTGMNGQTIYLMSYGSELPSDVRGGPPMNMGTGDSMYSPLDGIDFNILKIQIVASTANAVTSIPSTLVNVPHLSASLSNQTRNINFTAQNMMVMDGPFYFNDSLFDMNRIDYHIPLNNTEIWTLNDQTMVAHPFHLHGMQFQILDRDGNAPQAKEAGWKDVVLVHSTETVRIITRFTDFPDPVTPYMFHCHILMHEDDGMMGQYVIDDASNSIVEIDNDNATVYPNPVTATLNLRIKDNDSYKVDIYSAFGERVLSGNVSMEGQMIVADLPSGTYFLHLASHNRIFNTRFIKE
jgi:bilirubin oxidase